MLHGQSQKELYLSGLPWLRLCTSAAGGVGATCCMASLPKERNKRCISGESDFAWEKNKTTETSGFVC